MLWVACKTRRCPSPRRHGAEGAGVVPRPQACPPSHPRATQQLRDSACPPQQPVPAVHLLLRGSLYSHARGSRGHPLLRTTEEGFPETCSRLDRAITGLPSTVGWEGGRTLFLHPTLRPRSQLLTVLFSLCLSATLISRAKLTYPHRLFISLPLIL